MVMIRVIRELRERTIRERNVIGWDENIGEALA